MKVNGPEKTKLGEGRNSNNGRSIRGYILTYSRLYKEIILLALDSQQGEGVPEFLRPHYPSAAHSGGHPVGYVIIRFVTH